MKTNKNYKREILISVLISLLIAKFITANLFFIGYVPSISMRPTLMEDDRVFVTKNFDEIMIGDIYTFNKNGKTMVKRCIAGPGDQVVINNDNVYVNDVLIDEQYVSSQVKEDINLKITIPKNKYLFLGDNRRYSNDARYWDDPLVSKDDITGKVKYIIFPFSRISRID